MKSLMIAAACGAMALAGTAQAQTAERATIVVTGQGVAEAAPDTFSLTAEIAGRGADQAEAVRRLVEVQTAVTGAVSKLEGLTEVEVTTGLPQVSQIDGVDCERSQKSACEPAGYVATLSVVVEGRPALLGGDAVSLAAERGASDARLSKLYIADDTDLRRRAARAAYADALRQAEAIAEASGRHVVRMTQVEQPRNDPFYSNAYAFNAEEPFYGAASVRPRTGIGLTPDTVRVQTALQVTFEIE